MSCRRTEGPDPGRTTLVLLPPSPRGSPPVDPSPSVIEDSPTSGNETVETVIRREPGSDLCATSRRQTTSGWVLQGTWSLGLSGLIHTVLVCATSSSTIRLPGFCFREFPTQPHVKGSRGRFRVYPSNTPGGGGRTGDRQC